ncbi:MAG TPA: hypothetical protein VMW58_05895 [Anaerolineae bacterium]|nr:hypothetical protein [Anaerolineae bacterium]
MGVDPALTARTRQRYDRVAPVYDASEAIMERFLYARWRRRLWAGVKVPEIL